MVRFWIVDRLDMKSKRKRRFWNNSIVWGLSDEIDEVFIIRDE